MSKSLVTPLVAPMAAPLVRAAGVGGSGGSDGLTLVANNYLQPSRTFTRASAGTNINAAGNFVEFGNNVPRFGRAGLLLEGQRTNAVRNPRGEGSTPPSGDPTHWTGLSGTSSGVTRTILGSGTANGLDYVDYSIVGTASSALTLIPRFETVGNISAANNQTWTQGVFLSWVSGSPALIEAVQAIRMYDAGNALTGSSGLLSGALPITSTPTRFVQTATIPLGQSPAVASVEPGLRISIPSGTVCAHVLRIGWPSAEQADFASSSILPAPAVLAASTRLDDNLSWALAGLGVPATGICTVFGAAVFNSRTDSENRSIVQIDDGTRNNRFLLRMSGGGSIQTLRVLSTVSAFGGVAGSPVAGVEFRFAVAFDGAGKITASMNGAAVSTVSGGPVAGLTTMRVGNDTTAAFMFGSLPNVAVYPGVSVPDAALRALAT